MRYICSIILIFLLLVNGFSQETDSSKWKPLPRSYRVGLDALGLIRGAVQPGLSMFELTGEVDTKKYIFALDLGSYSHTLDSLPRYDYHISGRYFRVGVDANLIKNDKDESVVAFGIRYGRARFKDKLNYSVSHPLYGTFNGLSAANSEAAASWLELNFGMKARVWKMIWMGYQARFKFGLRIKNESLFPYEIPGYGPSETVTDKNTYWGFNYYILFGINANR